VESCRDDTRLCVAADLTAPSESVATRSIAQWRRGRATLGKRPAVFLLLANPR
jgi:16S rRNA (cytidine1402-2'-O)-methyltransferase